MKKTLLMICCTCLVLGICWIGAPPEAEGYESYHDPNQNDNGYCASCHPGFGGGPSDVLHYLHTGGNTPLTTNCNLCHTGSGRDNPLTMWSTGDAGDGLGCAGCHGRDYGETIGADYRGFPITDLPKMSGYGLRRHHQSVGITQCIACHGDVLPWPEGPDELPYPDNVTQPPYYARADVRTTGTCNADGSEDSSETEPNGSDTLGLDNDGDGLYDQGDPDCEQQPECTTDADCDDGNECTANVCNAGICEYPNEPAGTTCGDPSDTECSNPDSCDGTGVCEPNNEPPGFACGDQGIECLIDDACDGAGACTDNGFATDGTPCGDPSSDQCNNADTCQAGVCNPNWVPAGTACDDGLYCNVDEACDGGGACVGGSLNPCDDGAGCTDDSCDEAGDACVNTPNDANCPDDGLYCNGTEFCDPVNDCSSTGDPCLAGETCNEVNDVCEEPDLCGNGTVDPGEDCDGTVCCAANCTWATAGTACGDPSDTECSNPDSCDGTGVCEPNNEPQGFACGDQGIECLQDDACDGAGACTDNGFATDGTPCGDPSSDQCDNADQCVSGACDPNWVPANTACNDGLFCNENEACDGGGTCGGGNALDCSNGLYCDGDEVCNEAADTCDAGTPPDCSDGVNCTDDSCDEASDACVNTANDANCSDDGLYCNGTEFCDPVADCSSTGDPCLAGETCDEVNDVCEAPPVVIDLDIAQFRVTKRVRLSGKKAPEVEIKLVVKNNGDFNDATRPATVTGRRDGVMVYTETRDVADPVGNGRSRYDFTPYLVSEAGDIMWEVVIFDDDPDVDVATALTQVVP